MEDIIIKTSARLMIPIMQIYGLYIVFHGHLTPGGGFQGGTVIGASMIMLALAFGLKEGKRRASHGMSTFLESSAMFYAYLGLIGIVLGANFLANKVAGVPVGTPGNLLSSGIIFGINIVVGFKVASTGKTLFYVLAEEYK